MALTFVLNGGMRSEADVRPSTTVLDYLRDSLHLTGTKEGCAEGDCGACTIAVGRPEGDVIRWRAVNSCLMQLPQLDGTLVRTVEGLGGPEGLERVQELLAEGDGTQCGFCTPGFVMSMHVLERCGGPASEGAIHEALAGNLCRCTGYRPIVDACRALAAPDEDATAFADARDAAEATELADAQAPAAYEAGAQHYLIPRTLRELVAARAAHPEGVILGGGTDLGLIPSKQRRGFAVAILTGRVEGLATVRREADGTLAIGAAATYEDVLPALDDPFPAFAALVRRIGSRQIRSLGTLAGNLGTASPVGDTIPLLMALDATVDLASAGAGGAVALRVVPVRDFVLGYRRTALASGEVIAAIRIPPQPEGARLYAYKLSKRFDQDISTVLGAFRIRVADGRVAAVDAYFGGMAERAKRAEALEGLLLRSPWAEAEPEGLAEALAVDFSPVSDHRAGSAYRLAAAANLVRRLRLESTGATFPLRLEALAP